MQKTSRLQTFYQEHKKTAIALLIGFALIIILIVVIFTTSNNNDGVVGTDSRDIDAVAQQDRAALQKFPIANYLPIVSKDPAYTISYELNQDDTGAYSLTLTLNAFSASARSAMVDHLLKEDFGGEDPLTYNLKIENYYNPFTNFTLADLKSGHLPENIVKSDLYQFGDSPYTVQTFTHTLYDGSTNTYRAVYENGEPKTLPALLFTYADLPFLDSSQVKSINALQ